MSSTQEIYGRRGRVVTDEDAKDITRVEELAYDLKVREVMTSEVKSVSSQVTMKEALEIMRANRISGAPVLDEGKIIGIVSIEDLIRAMAEGDLNAPVCNYMSVSLITIKAYDSVVKAIETFTTAQVGRLPVIDENGELVGMITKGDITRGILIALQKDYRAEEVRRYRASHLFEDIHSDRTTLVLRYHIKPQDFTNGGQASSNIKRALLRLGASPLIARRCGIAVYEAEMNLVIHTTHGGILKVEVEPKVITMKTEDTGPGIADIELAMQAGWSTATEQVRELGFGAGMGLVNIQRIVDKMTLTSTPGQGTKLEMKIFLDPEESLRESIPQGELTS